MMAGLWNVSNATLKAGDVTGIWKLTVVTSLLQVRAGTASTC